MTQLVVAAWLLAAFLLAGHDVLRAPRSAFTSWAVVLLVLLFLLALFGVITRGT